MSKSLLNMFSSCGHLSSVPSYYWIRSIVTCIGLSHKIDQRYSTSFKQIEKINATAPQSQPQSNVLKNVAHSLEPGETPSSTFLNITKHDKIMTKNQFTGTATQRNRIVRQFNNDY